jgi:carboxypeptidase C (cathepsin A)
MIRRVLAAVVAGALVSAWAASAMADDEPAKADAAHASDKAGAKKDETELPPLPADKSIKQTVKTARGVLSYTATVGSLPVRDDKGKKIGEVVFTAYTLDGRDPATRPVTFAFNGGPGAASVYLNLGAIGPKHMPFGGQGETPSTAVQLVDNPDTWLDMTDLVFIDPIGTGYSRSLVGDDEAKKRFFTMKSDVAYLSRIVFDWLVANGRMPSPKYVVGESYGGFRAPRITHYLQTVQGVGVSGIVMLSPYLDSNFENDDDTSPMGWAMRLPSMAAAELERQGKLTPAALKPVEDYAQSEFLVDFMRGPRDPAATARTIGKMTSLLGVDPALAQTMGGRVDTQTLLRELYRRQGKVGSRYDINVTTYDPFPYSYEARTGGWSDPILDDIIAPTTSAMVDFDTRVVGWKAQGEYQALSRDVGRKWSFEDVAPESVTDLRQAMAIDPKMKVLIAHGFTDLSCPFFASQLIIEQIPAMGDPNQIRLAVYPGGHMFYSRPDSRAALHRDAESVFGG